jgi:hypothetical protein
LRGDFRIGCWVVFSKKIQEADRAKWIDRQILRLLNDNIEVLIKKIEQMVLNDKVKIAVQQKILNYYNRAELFHKKTKMLFCAY